jgi:hypothetical protein
VYGNRQGEYEGFTMDDLGNREYVDGVSWDYQVDPVTNPCGTNIHTHGISMRDYMNKP